MFNVGSPFSAQGHNDGRLHFAAFRIGERAIEAVDISVPAADPTRFEIPGHRTRVPPNRDNTDGVLGGWAVRIEGLTPSGR